MPLLLDESSDDDSDDAGDATLRVDAAFAKQYSKREQKRLDSRRAAGGGDGAPDSDSDSDSDSENSDDDGAAALTPGLEADVLKTMAAIRRRDAAVYDGATAFFGDAQKAPRAKAAAPATTFKDLERARLVKGDAGADEVPRHPHEYDAEQRALRAAMVEFSGDADEEGLFRTKHKEETADARAPVRAALDELRAAPGGESQKKEDAFLEDFVTNRRWAAPADGAEVMPNDAEEEAEVDAFEAAYNFRFESGAVDIATHARTAPGSLRRPNNKRKEAREARRERKAADKRRKEHELKRLKKELAQQEVEGDEPEAEAEVSGGFRYRQVEANGYGLGAEEILRTPDADLNKLVSVKRLAPYRDAEFVVNADRRKRWRRDQAARDAAYVEEKASAKRKRKRARRKDREAGDGAGADLPAPHRAAYGL